MPDVDLAEERLDREDSFWRHEFVRLGMKKAQADRLAHEPGCDRHGVRVALDQGCDPDLVFLIFSG